MNLDILIEDIKKNIDNLMNIIKYNFNTLNINDLEELYDNTKDVVNNIELLLDEIEDKCNELYS